MNYAHIATVLPLPDPAFDAYWQDYLAARPDLVEGASLELEREQFRLLQKVAFIAGREAAQREFALLQSPTSQTQP